MLGANERPGARRNSFQKLQKARIEADRGDRSERAHRSGASSTPNKKGSPEGLPLLLYPRFRFRRGETGPPRDKRQPIIWFARRLPPVSSFNRRNHGLAGHDLARAKAFWS